jgi:hypothetical protein
MQRSSLLLTAGHQHVLVQQLVVPVHSHSAAEHQYMLVEELQYKFISLHAL